MIQNGAHLIRAVDDRICVFPLISNIHTRLMRLKRRELMWQGTCSGSWLRRFPFDNGLIHDPD
ncbi:MAG TPA: hypothetical protein VF797_00635, partial [Noviherbaspirillum sp.]